ncbi:MAG: PepSY domain-containing protein [Halopseudomonas aestusnigri]
MQISVTNRSFLVLILWGVFFVIPSVLNIRPLMRNTDQPTNCCQQSTDSGSSSEIISEQLEEMISEDQVRKVAESRTGGKPVEVSYVVIGKQQFYRVKTITPNSGQTYLTGVDAKTGEILFSDEVWWLFELFRT